MLTWFSLQLLETYTKPWQKTMCELGNQILDIGEDFSGVPAKKYFVDRGWSHASIDLNGKDGAKQLDLSKPIDAVAIYNIITDWGTTEHVSSLFDCFANVHNLCRRDGLMFHENPMTGHFPGHGFHYFTTEFYTALASACGYEILQLGINAAYENTKDGMNVHCVMRKLEDNDFITKAKFDKLAKNTIKND